MVVRKLVRVTGRVQGVGFRDYVRRLAAEMGLAGFVRNEDDGSVVAELEGHHEAVEAVVAAIRGEPPRFARVHAVEEMYVETTGETGFRVSW